MDADYYQKVSRATAVYPTNQGIAYCALGLNGEAGEVAEKIKKRIRDGINWDHAKLAEHRDGMKKELGDVQWYLAQLCTEYGFTLSEVMEANVEKLIDRKDRGVLGGSGDTR